MLPPCSWEQPVSDTFTIILSILLTLALAYGLSEWLVRRRRRDDEIA